MGDNDLTLTLTARVEQALGALDSLGGKLDKLHEKQGKLKESSEGFGAKAFAAFELVKGGAEKALEYAEKVAKAIAEIDKNLANLDRKGGASNLTLSQSLTGLGTGNLTNLQRSIRGTQGVLGQGELDSFVASLGASNEHLTSRQVSQLVGTAARGAPVIGNLSQLGELQHIFGDELSGADIGDLAVRFNQAVPGGFSGEAAKGVHELIGAGVDKYQALAVSANFNKVGQRPSLSALASYLQGGGSLDAAFAGKTGNESVDRATAAVLGSGRGLGTINADAASFRSVTSQDVIGNELAKLPEATRREIEARKQERSYEINRNIDSDLGAGEEARADEAQVKDAISSFEANGNYLQAVLLKQKSMTYGDRFAAKSLGRNEPVKVEVRNGNPKEGY